MVIIFNLTQHAASAEQLEAGVVDLPPELRAKLVQFLTFTTAPNRARVESSAADVAALCVQAATRLGLKSGVSAMIGGAPFLMSALEAALLDHHIQPIYAFSERVSSEETQPDGSVRKVNVFKHAGFVPAN